MARSIRSGVCKNCKNTYQSREKEHSFCSRSCSAIYNNKNRGEVSEKSKKKISDALKAHYKNNPDKIRRGSEAAKSVAKATKGKYNKNPKSILDFSKRTVSKICARIGLGCSNCGWNEHVCDIHHIVHKSEGGTDGHQNLAYLCPNCHRLAHAGKLEKEKITSLDIYFQDEWLKKYYG